MSESTEQVTAKAAEAPAQAPVTTPDEKYPLKHKGFGRYEVDGVTYESKEAALQARKLLLERDALEAEVGDVIPPGVKIHERVLEFRGSILEVPMNEVYLPDGSINPMYDRAWVYAWAAYNGTDIADKQAKGYEIVRYEELKEMVDNGKAPAHYLSLLRRDGDFLVYGDLILMRVPRVRWRQWQREKFERAMGAFKRTEQKNLDMADNMGVRLYDLGKGANELTIRL